MATPWKKIKKEERKREGRSNPFLFPGCRAEPRKPPWKVYSKNTCQPREAVSPLFFPDSVLFLFDLLFCLFTPLLEMSIGHMVREGEIKKFIFLRALEGPRAAIFLKLCAAGERSTFLHACHFHGEFLRPSSDESLFQLKNI